ncbi:hypothetical protein CJ226_12125 [Microbacterium sp. UMB0228]|uniref:hypothetical protein n=1 Tax=Microbacterium sp. UMB0228 TaxID=2029109 RepID=UPI000C7F93F3|nr:hypothetical protein [Microbacterium sp. UMB0228]PMC03540.1 hypothetical protein CJ226_12125 [Microbacterium sp. UMB0228]
MPGRPWEGRDRIVAAGILACNPHNTQPWRIRSTDGVIEISGDPDREMPRTDASGREHYAGLGCAIEQMAISAAALGYRPQVQVFPDGPGGPAARLQLAPEASGPPADVDLAAAIPDRHTNRGPYDASPVTSSQLTALTGAATIDGIPASVTWITEPTARTALGALYVQATQAIIDDEEQSKESFSWFRNDRADIDRHRDGLTLDCQGLDDTTVFFAKILPAQFRHDGDQFWLQSTRDVHTATAAAYGIVRVDDVIHRAAQVTYFNPSRRPADAE